MVKKKKLETRYKGLTFVLHPSIYKDYYSFIIERGGKLVSSIEKIEIFDDQLFLICPKEKFLDFWDPLHKIIMKKENEKLFTEKEKEKSKNYSNSSSDEDDELIEEEDNGFLYQIYPPSILSDSINILNHEKELLYPIFSNCSFRVYLNEKDEKFVKEKISYYDGIICERDNTTATLITTKDLLEKMDQTTFEEFTKIDRVLYLKNFKDIVNRVLKSSESFELMGESVNSDHLERFKFFEKRWRRCNMDNIVIGKKYSMNESYLLPIDIINLIFTYLTIPDYLNTRLLSKAFFYQNSEYWKAISLKEIKNNPWIPNCNLENFEFKHWYEFYRKYLHPILSDCRIIRKKWKNKLQNIPELMSKEYFYIMIQLGILIDLKPASKLKLGSSKFGGTPDLPESVKWPKNGYFIAQINLRDPTFKNSFLGQKYGLSHPGILYFFNINDQPSVIYSEVDESQLKRTTYPEWYGNDIEYPKVQKEMKFFESIGYVDPPLVKPLVFDEILNEKYCHMFAKEDIIFELKNIFPLLSITIDDMSFFWYIKKDDLLKTKENPKLFEKIVIL